MKQNKFIFGLLFFLLIAQFASADRVKTKKDNKKDNNQNKSTTAGCTPGTALTYLEFNNVKALIRTSGDMWSKNNEPQYEVPKGSGKHSSYASSIWIGGTDVNEQLRFAGVRYRSEGNDFWPGPLIKSGSEISTVSADICRQYDKHFVISKKEVKDFRTWYEAKANGEEYDPNYTIPLSILEWPAHGPVDEGAYDWNLAPFRDLNGNNLYEPLLGEYPRFEFDDDILPCGTTIDQMVPRLYGDQTIWWVYNDNGNVHTESKGAAIGMELRGQAFAFASNDELNNATFYHFEIINRSTYTLKNAYFAVFTDADIGDAYNDLCGCDVGRGLGYMYNDGPDGDGSLKTYGANPPAIGIDFFEGPFMDPSWDNKDRPSAYLFDDEGNRTEQIDMSAGPDVWYNGSINGLNFGDGMPNNERWGMRRFIYFINSGGPIVGGPEEAIDYYNFLIGNWKDNSKMTYGGTGAHSSEIPADFMFPGTSDITDWGTHGESPDPKDWKDPDKEDKRFVHSAGPFTLQPGAINFITTGVIWARSYKDGNFESVKLVLLADDKAQKLFENCFKTIDGPDAPELDILEGDQSFIFNLWNKKGSNNYEETPEDYTQNSPFIVCPPSVGTNCNKKFVFEGYIVYQLKNKDVSVGDIYDINFAKPIFQCDINNGIGSIINYEWNGELQTTVPKLMVEASDEGIKHSFEITEDMFSTGTSSKLVNHKKYYYIAVAYAYNNYKTYDPTDPNSLDGQKEPFLIGRNNIKKYTAIPHLIDQNEGGTSLNTSYGEELPITQLDGYGTGGNVLELKQESIDRIMAGPPWKIDSINYTKNHSPIRVKITNPIIIRPDNYILKFDSIITEYNSNTTHYDRSGFIGDANWYLLPLSTYGSKQIGLDTNDNPIYAMGYDTVFSSQFISIKNEQQIVYKDNMTGIAIEIARTLIPGLYETEFNGFLESSITYSGKQWLDFVEDDDRNYNNQINWIRSGTYSSGDNPTPYDDHQNLGKYFDPDQFYEGILQGAWAPNPVVAGDFVPTKDSPIEYKEGVTPQFVWKGVVFDEGYWRYASVDIVITKDKSKWTRCPVVETSNNNLIKVLANDGTLFSASASPASNIGNKFKFRLRASPSVDKNGNSDVTNIDTADVNNPNFIGEYGMGWFPGYAIDVETGERLNMMFGEDSHRGDNNGQDMLWNPTSTFSTPLFESTNGNDGELIKGGKHYIYIMGINSVEMNSSLNAYSPLGSYDYGKTIYKALREVDNIQDEYAARKKTKTIYKNMIWASMPMMKSQFEIKDSNDPYKFIQGDVKIRIRMANPYRKRIESYKIHEDADAPNGNFPMYRFSTYGLSASINQTEVATEAMAKVNIVPNPYYAYSEYETSPIDHKVKFTNLPNTCTISIYNVGGTLVRRFEKDNNLTYLDWDLKNEYGITISGGVYIIHINAPGVGEKILKWFGALRPIDLNNF